jgi:hypothetical protein
MRNETITIPDFMKEKESAYVEVCNIINEELKENPNMSLAEFAGKLNDLHILMTYERVKRVVNAQFGAKT